MKMVRIAFGTVKIRRSKPCCCFSPQLSVFSDCQCCVPHRPAFPMENWASKFRSKLSWPCSALPCGSCLALSDHRRKPTDKCRFSNSSLDSDADSAVEPLNPPTQEMQASSPSVPLNVVPKIAHQLLTMVARKSSCSQSNSAVLTNG